MVNPYRLAKELNASAAAAGTARSILQFENVATQSQYLLPYEVASRYVVPGAEVLDWGCGNGHFSLLLERLGAKITAYSYEEPPSCMSGSSNFRFVAGIPGDPRTIPFSDASFDVACSVGVLEHVAETGGDERASLSEIARVLKAGGVFLTFHLPNRGGWIEPAGHRMRPNKYVHTRRYTEQEIRTLWVEAGLTIEELGTYNALPRGELRHLPPAVRHSDAFARTYNAIDDAIAAVLPRVCTNYFVVARKR